MMRTTPRTRRKRSCKQISALMCTVTWVQRVRMQSFIQHYSGLQVHACATVCSIVYLSFLLNEVMVQHHVQTPLQASTVEDQCPNPSASSRPSQRTELYPSYEILRSTATPSWSSVGSTQNPSRLAHLLCPLAALCLSGTRAGHGELTLSKRVYFFRCIATGSFGP